MKFVRISCHYHCKKYEFAYSVGLWNSHEYNKFKQTRLFVAQFLLGKTMASKCKLILIFTSQGLKSTLFFAYMCHAKSGPQAADWGWEGRLQCKWPMGTWEKIRCIEERGLLVWNCFFFLDKVNCLYFEPCFDSKVLTLIKLFFFFIHASK